MLNRESLDSRLKPIRDFKSKLMSKYVDGSSNDYFNISFNFKQLPSAWPLTLILSVLILLTT